MNSHAIVCLAVCLVLFLAIVVVSRLVMNNMKYFVVIDSNKLSTMIWLKWNCYSARVKFKTNYERLCFTQCDTDKVTLKSVYIVAKSFLL